MRLFIGNKIIHAIHYAVDTMTMATTENVYYISYTQYILLYIITSVGTYSNKLLLLLPITIIYSSRTIPWLEWISVSEKNKKQKVQNRNWTRVVCFYEQIYFFFFGFFFFRGFSSTGSVNGFLWAMVGVVKRQRGQLTDRLFVFYK